MEILGEFGREDIAKVYVGSPGGVNGRTIEFVESLQPPIPREKKWVLIISSSFGCPMKCLMCDAGGSYMGRLTSDEIISQVDYMVSKRFPSREVPVEKFKVQFARMGEPSLNPNVISALETLPEKYDAPGLMACVSTIAPENSGHFFDLLVGVKNEHYSGGHFQLQFSVHSTDDRKRNWLMPCKKWELDRISKFGDKFFEPGDRKLALNFAMTRGMPIDPEVIGRLFDPNAFCIKLTPLNPTSNTKKHGLGSALDPLDPKSGAELVSDFKRLGFDVILSIGELEENKIGSNCGQYVSLVKDSMISIKGDYQTTDYQVRTHPRLQMTRGEGN